MTTLTITIKYSVFRFKICLRSSLFSFMSCRPTVKSKLSDCFLIISKFMHSKHL